MQCLVSTLADPKRRAVIALMDQARHAYQGTLRMKASQAPVDISSKPHCHLLIPECIFALHDQQDLVVSSLIWLTYVPRPTSVLHLRQLLQSKLEGIISKGCALLLVGYEQESVDFGVTHIIAAVRLQIALVSLQSLRQVRKTDAAV